MRGFRSYSDEATFSWRDRSLVGVVGPIGSGKSSILDAISFALYGKTPRIERDTKSLINQRRAALHVSLTFEVGGATWKVVRSLRRGGASAHALYRIEGGDEIEEADRAREVGSRIEALLGLDFDAFRRSVLLAQNQFAGFLEATGTERNQVLKGVFGFDHLDQMRDIAKARLDGLGKSIAVLEDRRRSAEVDKEDLASRKAELTAAEERLTALEGLREPLADLDDLSTDAARRIEGSESELQRLDAMVGRIPDRDETETLMARAEGAAGSVASAEEEVQQAADARNAATSRRDEALEAVGGRDGLVRAGDLVATLKGAAAAAEAAAASLAGTVAAHEEAESLATSAAARAAEMRSAADAAATTAAAVEVDIEAGRQALGVEQQTHRAHVVRSDLVVGLPCPVCARPVESLPDATEPVPLAEAEQALADAVVRLEEAGVARKSAVDAAATAGAAEAATVAAVAAARSALDVASDEARAASGRREEAVRAAAAVVGEGEPETVLGEIRNSVAAADRIVDEALTAEEVARQGLESARAAAAAAVAAMGSLRTDLAALGGTLGVDLEVGEAPDALRGALASLRTAWLDQRASAGEEKAKAGDALAAAVAARQDLMAGMGLAGTDELVEVISVVRAEVTGLAGVVDLLEKRTAELEELATGEAGLIEASELLQRIHTDLAPSRFLEFVLDERRRSLGDLASEHLEMLTAGRYRFDESGDFLVADLSAADAVRAPSSLSGGETFLASLALALALAEMVSREGGRLDAFFLDEGFGSLDPEHLDLALDGIERLVTSGSSRLVVLVSHVPALMDRVDDVVMLDRDPVTGDTRVLAGAEPQ